MSETRFTPGPWVVKFNADETEAEINGPNDYGVQAFDLGGTFQIYGRKAWETEVANLHLIAAAPDLYDGCNALLGLIQLILGRDDLPPDLRVALTDNHRVIEAEAAIARARGETSEGSGT